MSEKYKKLWRISLTIAGIFFATSIGCLIFLAYLGGTVHPPSRSIAEINQGYKPILAELDLYEAKWRNAKISDYEILIDGSLNIPINGSLVIPSAKNCFLKATLTIKKNKLDSVIEEPIELRKLKVDPSEECRQYDYLIPDKMFNKVREDLKVLDPNKDLVGIIFDKDLGYITLYRVVHEVEFFQGCCSGLTFEKFRAIR